MGRGTTQEGGWEAARAGGRGQTAGGGADGGRGAVRPGAAEGDTTNPYPFTRGDCDIEEFSTLFATDEAGLD